MREAMWWEKYGESAVRCNLCPFRCILQEAQTGQCRARKNVGGKLYALNYARVVAAHVDPVEKKPVFHFLPGTPIYSIATAGCNLHCKYCQNWNISQSSPLNTQYTYMDPEDIVKAAKSAGCLSIAYTYTEPIIFYELMYETAKLAKSQGLFNVMISAGFINEEPLRKLCQVMDVIKIDFKSFNEDFYRQVVSGDLSPVLNTMKIIKEQGVWLEVVNLLVPTLNDSPEDIKGLCLWIKENLGSATPVHFSRFHPTYKLTNLPPTPLTTLESAAKIAKDTGLKYVYLGNVPDHPLESTYCPKCGKVLIKRLGYQILENNIRDSRCKFCGEKIEGIWSSDIKKN
ncbi:MAG: AmmeMemoRadiSam system radical SAM enzyme [Candidatus Omnitrophica bacterium]|nr:AmmeMemoRadiSam system radical SAM enzyme [Candidatus Omnitrophota bacterium]